MHRDAVFAYRCRWVRFFACDVFSSLSLFLLPRTTDLTFALATRYAHTHTDAIFVLTVYALTHTQGDTLWGYKKRRTTNATDREKATQHTHTDARAGDFRVVKGEDFSSNDHRNGG